MNSFHILAALTVSDQLPPSLTFYLYILFMAELEAVGLQVNELNHVGYALFSSARSATCAHIHFKHWLVCSQIAQIGNTARRWADRMIDESRARVLQHWCWITHVAAIQVNLCCMCIGRPWHSVLTAFCPSLIRFVVFNQFGGLHGIPHCNTLLILSAISQRSFRVNL